MGRLDPNYGHLTRLVVAQPAVGTDHSYTFPVNRRWKLIAVTTSLTTAVAAANRHVTLQLSHEGGAVWNTIAPVVQTASLTYTYIFNADGSGIVTAVNNWVVGVLPNIFTFIGGDLLSTVTANMQAADQFSSMLLYLEAWIEYT